jgi:putative ABC transport system substrate-binding protein
MSRLVWLTSRPIDSKNALWAEFSVGMRELGWIEGRDFTIENLHFDGQSERLPGLAAAAVQRKFDLILCAGRLPAVAAREATTAIPIVFHYVDDPVGAGLAASLPRPGANITGLGGLWRGISGKMLELLTEAVPMATRIALLTDPALAQQADFEAEAKAVAHRMNVTLTSIELRSPDGLGSAFATVAQVKPDALLIWGQPFLFMQAPGLARLAIEHRLPAIIPFEEVAQAGILMSYGARLLDDARRLPYYVDRILKGADPGSLPVEQPSRFYLTINLKTAKSLGLTLPLSLLHRAHRFIE